MKYKLKHYDKVVAIFTLIKSEGATLCKELEIVEEYKSYLPLDLISIDLDIVNWIKGRTIPKNRAYVDNFLAKQGLGLKDTIEILNISRGISLNDSYWIEKFEENNPYEKVNLYKNRFSRILSNIAFTGYGSKSNHLVLSSPEFTTNGMLPKAWRRISGEIELYKGGTIGAANTGKEPYSEFYASQIAKQMGLNAIEYNLAKWKGTLCSRCKLFTSIDVGFIPAGKMVRSGGIKKVLEYYQELGELYYNELIEMLVFDAIICNTDRHLGNFGFLIDSRENKIIGPAPIFDNGLSLFCYALDEIDDLSNYSKTRQPALYDDFVGFIKPYLTSEIKSKVRKLIGFKFKKHSRYNLDKKRLKKIEEFIKIRVEEVLGS